MRVWGVSLTIEKPELLELTRGETTIKGGDKNQSSFLIFNHPPSGSDHSDSHNGPQVFPCREYQPDFDALITLLGHEQSDIRIAAAGALGTLGDPKAIEPLFKACMDENSAVKSAARDALAQIVAQMHYSE
jgi:hypothetical protein